MLEDKLGCHDEPEQVEDTIDRHEQEAEELEHELAQVGGECDLDEADEGGDDNNEVHGRVHIVKGLQLDHSL